MKKTKKFALIVLCIAAVCLICFFLGRSVGKSAGVSEIDAVVLENRLTEINQYASLTYSYTNMAEFENTKDFYGIKLPFTTKGFIITYEGEIKAGMDLSKATVNVSGSKIEVILPPAEILSHEIDEESLEVFDETTSIFNPLKVEDYNGFNKDQKAAMEAKAADKGILAEAEKNASVAIENFVKQIAGEDYTVAIQINSAK